MIRKLRSDDMTSLTELLKDDPLIHWPEVLDDITANEQVWVGDEGRICGFAYIMLAEKETRHYRIHLYVVPAERRRGIGTELWRTASRWLEKEKPNLISTHFAVDNGDPAPFYRQQGFKKWYGCVNLEYRGGFQPENDLQFIKYDDEKHLEQYARIRQDAFYQMHRDNDIKPYRGMVDEQREFIRSQGDKTFLAMDGEQIMAGVVFFGDCLEFLVVTPAYQRRGLGKKTVQFAINSLLKQGASSVTVCSVIGNDSAETLYRSVGFETITTYHVYRQFGDR